MAKLMPLSLTVCCLSKKQIGFTFLVLAHQGSPGKRTVKRVCVCVCACVCVPEGSTPTLIFGGTRIFLQHSFCKSKTSSSRLVVSVKHELVADRQTDTHATTAYTA